MLTERLLADATLDESPSREFPSPNPHDSSRLLLGLMTLHKRAEATGQSVLSAESLSGIISKGVLRSLMSALHFRDAATIRHSRRVALLATGIAKHLGWEAQQITLLEVAALLHDMGKIGVPDNILFKPGRLSPDETELMDLHHNIGVDVLQACRVNKEVVKFIVQAAHHYHGYIGRTRPAGTNFCQGARILAVADAYDSLATDKTYRDAKSHADILAILKEASGSQFDGNIVRALERWVENEGLPFSETLDDPTPAVASPKASGPQNAQEASSLGHIFSYLYLLESLYDGFYLVDADLRFVIWNRGAEKLLGRDAYDMLGQAWTSGLLGYADKLGESLAENDVPMKQALESGSPATQNVQIQTADGRWIDVEMQSVPLIDAEGRLHGVAEIFRDLSRNSLRPREYRDLEAGGQPRLADVAGQPGRARDSTGAHAARAAGENGRAVLRDLFRRRLLQDDQRHLWTRRRRPGPGRRGELFPARGLFGRPGGPLRRRGVRHRLPGHRAGTGNQTGRTTPPGDHERKHRRDRRSESHGVVRSDAGRRGRILSKRSSSARTAPITTPRKRAAIGPWH